MRNAPAFSVHWHYQGKPSRAYLYILCAPPLLTPCKARGVQMERDRITTSTVRRNPLLSESDRRGFSPKITNAPPPTFDSWEATGGAGGGRGRGLELINANSGVPFSNDHQGLFFAHRLVHRGGGGAGGGGGGRRGAGGRGELINANSDVPFSNDHQGLFFAHRLVHRGGGGEPYVKSILAFEPV